MGTQLCVPEVGSPDGCKQLDGNSVSDELVVGENERARRVRVGHAGLRAESVTARSDDVPMQ